MAVACAEPSAGLRQVQVAVLAKAPMPGLAKTRLIPALGPQGTARLQRRLTCAAVRTALDARLGAVTLWCAPHAQHHFFLALHQATGVQCLVQPSGDLGQRMRTAFRLHCEQGPLLLIGTDCPPLTPAHLRQAAQALLDGSDAVFHPAEDGGYVLVGLRRPQAELFEGIAWSTAAVMAQTRERALAAGLRMREFETLWDLDVPADLVRWHAWQGQPQASTSAPAQSAAVAT
ncbi:MAG: TIGR04282 family arsenosugar biosynthesis glycosyltransferase [Burkholderiales bacterium]|nr:TIGR04282 family arsenosugar biosynthesis glycosyltransferase [Burkholderiales bacterium]